MPPSEEAFSSDLLIILLTKLTELWLAHKLSQSVLEAYTDSDTVNDDEVYESLHMLL